MVAIIGLGNPGSMYDGTRHNIGFDVAEKLAQKLNIVFKPGKGEYLYARSSFKSQEILIAKPLTYMNESGVAVADIQERFDVPLEQLLVVCDDFQLLLGQLRLRANGSDGGHNGLYSIIYQLQSEEFPRLRCGIGSVATPKDKSRMADFVLDQFAPDEGAVVLEMIERAKNACLSFVTSGLTQTMNIFNKKEPSKKINPKSEI